MVSELSRRQIIALPTVKNTAAYDIVALNMEGTRHANIQVKASSKKVGFFPMPRPEKIRATKCDYFVLVRWLESVERYDCFLLSGKEAKEQVEVGLRSQAESIAAGRRNVEFPCVIVGPKNAKSAERWRRAWVTWRL